MDKGKLLERKIDLNFFCSAWPGKYSEIDEILRPSKRLVGFFTIIR